MPAIETALRHAPGKCVVNSINFEDGDARARKVLDLCRTYGAAVVGLTIDEQGMAHDVERKLAVAGRLHDLVVGEYGFNPSDTHHRPAHLHPGQRRRGLRGSAVAHPGGDPADQGPLPRGAHHAGGQQRQLGLSPQVRHVVNALMLYHAVRAGLDLAIFNAAKVLPVAAIPADQRRAVEDLIFDRRAEGYDPLKVVLAMFGAQGGPAEPEPEAALLPVAERLRRDILGGEKRRILDDVDEALGSVPPLEIINEILLGAMREVGERFGAGEMQLPFVLESAEAMKAAVKRVEPHLPRDASSTKGRVILATVKGDVHDIGKNLVEIILSNNGYLVRKPRHQAAGGADPRGPGRFPRPTAIGLSGLLVKSTTVMRDNLATMEERGLRIPVILGGAALTRDFVADQCQSAYSGPVLYAEDAFEGLRHMDAIVSGGAAQVRPEPHPRRRAPTDGCSPG